MGKTRDVVVENTPSCKVCDRGFAARWEVELRYLPVSDKKGMGVKKVLRVCSACIGELAFIPKGIQRLEEVMGRLGDDLVEKAMNDPKGPEKLLEMQLDTTKPQCVCTDEHRCALHAEEYP